MTANNSQETYGDPLNASPDGEFVRDTNYIEDRIIPGISERRSRKMALSTGRKKLAATAWPSHVPVRGRTAPLSHAV